LLSAKLIDIIFISLVVAAIAITAIVLARVLTDAFAPAYLESQASNTEDSLTLTITDPDLNDVPYDSTIPSPPAEDDLSKRRLGATASGEKLNAATPGQFVLDSIYGSSPFLLPIAWGAVAGTLLWRGKVKSEWSRHGYDYETFKLVTRMRGSETRIRLLNAISDGSAKNKLQLAREYGVDWKTIDNHIEMLLRSGLVEEKMVIGTARYYGATKSGKKILSLLSSEQTNVYNGKDGTMQNSGK